MRARAGGASTYKKVRPPRTIVLKSTLQKIFGFEFYEPTLHSREARGTPQNQWFSLATAKENASKSNLISTLARVMGLEPTASSVTGKRSNQLSYTRNELQNNRFLPLNQFGVDARARTWDLLFMSVPL